jgi:hypothetical protein
MYISKMYLNQNDKYVMVKHKQFFLLMYHKNSCGAVVERRTAKRKVPGSNPGRGKNFFQVVNSGKRYRIACFSRYKTRHTVDLLSTSGRYRLDIALLSKLNIAATSFHPKCDAWEYCKGRSLVICKKFSQRNLRK